MRQIVDVGAAMATPSASIELNTACSELLAQAHVYVERTRGYFKFSGANMSNRWLSSHNEHHGDLTDMLETAGLATKAGLSACDAANVTATLDDLARGSEGAWELMAITAQMIASAYDLFSPDRVAGRVWSDYGEYTDALGFFIQSGRRDLAEKMHSAVATWPALPSGIMAHFLTVHSPALCPPLAHMAVSRGEAVDRLLPPGVAAGLRSEWRAIAHEASRLRFAGDAWPGIVRNGGRWQQLILYRSGLASGGASGGGGGGLVWSHGWRADACALMPTACRMLRGRLRTEQPDARDQLKSSLLRGNDEEVVIFRLRSQSFAPYHHGSSARVNIQVWHGRWTFGDPATSSQFTHTQVTGRVCAHFVCARFVCARFSWHVQLCLLNCDEAYAEADGGAHRYEAGELIAFSDNVLHGASNFGKPSAGEPEGRDRIILAIGALHPLLSSGHTKCEETRPSTSGPPPPPASTSAAASTAARQHVFRHVRNFGEPLPAGSAASTTLCDELLGWQSECRGSDADRCEVTVAGAAGAAGQQDVASDATTTCEAFCGSHGAWCVAGWAPHESGGSCERAMHQETLACNASRTLQICRCRRRCEDSGPWACREAGCPSLVVDCALLSVACQATFNDIWANPPDMLGQLTFGQACPASCGNCPDGLGQASATQYAIKSKE